MAARQAFSDSRRQEVRSIEHAAAVDRRSLSPENKLENKDTALLSSPVDPASGKTTVVRMVLSSTLDGSSAVYERRVVSHIRTYNWPPLQLNFWIFIMLLASTSIVGVFGNFIQIQNQLDLPIPWYVLSPLARQPWDSNSCALPKGQELTD